MKKTMALMIVTLMMAMALNSSAWAATMQGKVIKTELGKITIHTYVAPEAGALVTSQIIEGPSKLVIIDALMLRPHAQELRTYALGLNKPVDRVFITHAHPDHWMGLEVLQDWPAVSLPATAGIIAKYGPMMIKGKKKALGKLVADKAVVPQGSVKDGELVIDGVRYQIETIGKSEGHAHMLITLPDFGVLIAQDLVYNQVHAFLAADAVKQWRQVLADLAARKGIKLVLSGHGEPAGPEVIAAWDKYLAAAGPVVASAKKGSKDVKTPLVEQFPGYRGPVLLDISNAMMFK